jgi:4-phosphopantoate--beta-alanine ligase
VRAALAASARDGLVVPEGLIAHGRGEAFDYLLGEATTPSARRAERVAASWLVRARRPVLSVNGNVAALAAREVATLAKAIPHLRVEVNLFHRTPARARRIARVLRAAGVPEVLGVRPTARIPGLPSDRAHVDREGIWRADVCLVPLEDGDRAEALRALGKRVISIDLNPLSRTSRMADLPIVDELTRALAHIAKDAGQRAPPPTVERSALLRAAHRTIARHLRKAAGARRPRRARRAPVGRRPSRGTSGRLRRTP